MVREIARIEVKPGRAQDFEQGAAAARGLFLAAQGCHGMELSRSVEDPNRYYLLVEWETVEDHVETFRASAAFAQWRSLVSDCFAAPPQVEHVEEIRLA